MLAQLTISNFAIVRELEIDFQNGMTVITGETGAGKSIAIDALGLCLGGRADADMVRAGAMRADLCARFALKDTPAALRWLEENDLNLEGSYFYSDSMNDLPLLEQVTHAVAVDPDENLRAEAVKRDWPVISLRD